MELMIENEVDQMPLSGEQESLVREAIQKTLEIEEFEDNVQVSVTFVDSDRIRALNHDFRGKDAVTDVLSFPQYSEDGWDAYEDEPVFLGDIVICLEQADRQAVTHGHTLARELAYLTCHSTLHLLGYDHIEPEDKQMMRQQEEKVMTLMGLERVVSQDEV